MAEGIDSNLWNLVCTHLDKPIKLTDIKPYPGDRRTVSTYVATIQNAYHETNHVLAVRINATLPNRMFHAYFINRIICSKLGTGVAKYVMAHCDACVLTCTMCGHRYVPNSSQCARPAVSVRHSVEEHGLVRRV